MANQNKPLLQGNKTYEFALKMAKMGLPVFPIVPNTKRPACPWKDESTTDPDKIRMFFLGYPNCNYGIHIPENVVVIDVDIDEAKGKHGDVVINELEAKQDIEDWISDGSTFTVVTPSGGKHLFLKVPYNVGNGHLFGKGVGIDVRGSTTGMALGPGSIVDGATYSIEKDVEIKEAPNWVRERLRRIDISEKESKDSESLELDSSVAIGRAKQVLKDRDISIQGLGGNNNLYETCCLIKDLGVSEEECVRLLLTPFLDGGKSWNESCLPPFSQDELKQTAGNAYRYGQDAVGSKTPVLMDAYDDDSGIEFQDASKALEEAELSIQKGLDAIFYGGVSILDRNETREYVVDEWFIAHGFTCMLAKRSTGKTIMLTDMGLRIACDMEWHGKRIAEGYSVVYLCGEDDLGLQEHINAWVFKHGVKPENDRFAVMTSVVDLMNPAEVEKWATFLKKKFKDKKVVLIVDTFQRATAAGGQNDDKDMQAAIKNVEEMAKFLKGPALISVHPPKHDPTAVLGSSVIENSSTGIMRLTNETFGKKLEVVRIKGPGEGNYSVFDFKPIGIGLKDQFGKERTGIVPIRTGGNTDGKMMDDLEDRHSINQAWAEVVKIAIDEVNTLPSPERSNVNISFVANWVTEDPDNSKFDILREVGEKNLSTSTVTRRLKEIFGKTDYPIELKNSNYGVKMSNRTFQIVKVRES